MHFSDIISGPKTGLGDGSGDGAIVTIWGYGLGSTQESSTIYCGGVLADHVYYWEDSDVVGDSGPADLYTYHKMQSISFSVDSTASDGAGTIYVIVGGETSNTLPFTVRSGNIYFIKTAGNGGSNSNPGTWASPWETIRKATYVGPLVAGDTVYVCDGVEESGLSNEGLQIKTTGAEDPVGTAANPVSIIAYPGADVLISGATTAIGNWQRWGEYWNFSKFKIISDGGGGVSANKGARFIGLEVTDNTCANGSNGAIGGSAGDNCSTGGGIKVLGNYIHDWGCDITSNQEHVFYLSNRSGSPCESYELGWNHLADNEARNALHLYDEGASGDFTGTMKLHDNAVISQTGAGFAIGNGNLPDPPAIPEVCWSMPVEVYNNLFIDCGIANSGGNYASAILIISGIRNFSDVKIYNNTIYGGIDPDDTYGYIYSPSIGNHEFMGTLDYKNNVVHDLNSLIWNHATWFQPPDWSTNNIWYNGGDSVPASPPSWDTDPITTNPLFVNPGTGDFTLQSGSPAIDAGTSDVSGTVLRDFFGGSWLGNIYEIGAYGYFEDVITPTDAVITGSVLTNGYVR